MHTEDATPTHGEPTKPSWPLILLPGLGAGERLFGPQREAFANLIVPPWIEPRLGERLPRYAERLAKAIDPGGPCFVGGMSFGGIVALELARHLDTRACFLIASVRSPREMPAVVRLLSPLAVIPPAPVWRIAPWVARLLSACGRRWFSRGVRIGLRELAESNGAFLPWAYRAVALWRPTPNEPRCPVHRIYGDADHVLEYRREPTDAVLPGGGHLISLTHWREVNEFLRTRMDAAREYV